MKKILSVDDEVAMLRVYQAVLKHQGYEVFVTSDPMTVAGLLEKHDLDLVILDVHMPKKNGFEIFTELKRKYQALPVLFITAFPQSFSMDSNEIVEMWKDSFSDGCTDILYKPFNIDTLYEKIEGLIGPDKAGEE